MDVVCEVCGAVGFKHLLVQCNNCKDSTRHRYCMDTIVYDGFLEWSCDDCLPKHNELVESIGVFYNQKQQNHIQLDPSITSGSDVDRVEATKELQPWGRRGYRSCMAKRHTSKHFLNGVTLNSNILIGKLLKHNDAEKEAESTNGHLIDSFKCVDGPNCSAAIPTLEIKEDINIDPTMTSMEGLDLSNEKGLSFPPKPVEELFPQRTKADSFPLINDFERCHLHGIDNSGLILQSVEEADGSSHMVERAKKPQPLEVVKPDGADHSALGYALEREENIGLENGMGSFEPTLNSMEWQDLSREKDSCSSLPKCVAGSIPQGTNTDLFPSNNDAERFRPSVINGSSPERLSEEQVDGSGPMLERWKQHDPLEVIHPFVKSIQGSLSPSNYSKPVQQSDQNIGNDHLSPSKVFMDTRSMSEAIERPCSSNGQGASAVDKDDLDRTKCMLDEEFIAPALDDYKRSSVSMADGCLVSNSDEVTIPDKHLLCTKDNREQGRSMVTSHQSISRGKIHCSGLNERCNSWNIHESSNPKSALIGDQQGVQKTSVHADNISNAKDVQYVNDANPKCSNAAQTFGNGMLKKRKGLVLQNNKDEDAEALQVEDLNQLFESDGQVKKHRKHVEYGVMTSLENCAEALRPGTLNHKVANNYMQAKKQKSIKANGDGNALLGDANRGCSQNNTAQLTSQDVVARDHCNVSGIVSAPTDQQCDIPTRPIDEPYWTGIMKIGQEYISLAAHLSNKACKMVQELSRSLPPVMKVTKYPKVKAYPSRWEESEPTAESIGLYFFSDNMRPNKDLDRLVQYVTDHSIVLKYVVGFAKLLIFPSVFLPEQSQMFQGRHYLWGVFKRRKVRSNRDPPVKRQVCTSQIAKKRKGQDKVQVDTLVQEKPIFAHSIPNGNQPSATTVNGVDTETKPGDGGKARFSSEAPAPTFFGVVDIQTPRSVELLMELKNEGAVVFPGNGLAKPVPIKL